MKTAFYDASRQYDAILEKLIFYIRSIVTTKDDDFIILCAGDTGTGKSMLMLHVLDKFMGDYKSVDYIGLTKGSFASGFKNVQAVPKGFKFLGNDEANISKREAMSKYNRDLLDLYYSCRGLNIFHWWNNPSVDIIDKPFIKDRVKGFILITTKDMDRPRIYYYFTKQSLIKILDKYGNLDIKTINKVKRKYAVFKGWFKDYRGDLKSHYLDKKNPRMVEKVDVFFEKYGDADVCSDFISTKVVSVMCGYKENYIRDMVKNGKIPSNFYTRNDVGYISFYKNVVPFLKELRLNNRAKSLSKLQPKNGFKKKNEE